MIYTNLYSDFKEYEFSKPIYDMLLYLRDTDLTKIQKGSYRFKDTDIFINCFEVTSIEDTERERLSECHRDYVDIQISVNGNEVYGFATYSEDNELFEEKIQDLDSLIYRTINNEKTVKANKGDVFIFYPNDIHRAYYKSSTIPKSRRIVVKVPVKDL